ncbi:MAG: Precorrin-2 methylase CobF [Candidatus Methanohalarchaeum thermophilum]|uniref:Precorrin-2 methylase CobF n=1 Tax=Methanohalarchaeum thermophilum TaxID=1903181 RepID=A0A1Q6DVI8_METT1|nr:MAG: Precorrin-2 methylase CobF [Candidatus Methanohalarchaeum thermophilum]
MLIGVSLGPGDPDLMTIRAKKALKTSDEVFVPGERAKNIVKKYCDPKELDFPMTEDEEVLKEYWVKNAKKVGPLAKEKKVSLAGIGDLCFFSTFGHVKKEVEKIFPEVRTRTIPGVSSITASAAKLDLNVQSSFEVTDGSEKNKKIVLKATKPKSLAEKLKNEGYSEFTLGENLFREDEKITKDLPEESSYFSLLVAEKEEQSWK